MGLYRTYSDIGFVIGPPLLGWILDSTGSFAWPLLVNAALVAVCALAFALFAKETRPASPSAPPPPIPPGSLEPPAAAA